MTTYHIKRVYEPASPSDGYRVLVDRLWPRGVSKEAAKLDEWYKDIAPSDDLRQWFGHQPDRFDEFRRRYQDELAKNSVLTDFKKSMADHPTVTLLYGAHDETMNQAVVLRDLLAK